jgi:hypothetical protein
MEPGMYATKNDPITTLVLPLRQFLVVSDPPEAWKVYDLYLFRDENVVFYVGRSQTAFTRVWSHLYDGFKGRSLVGRFILMNWPRALQFTVELMSSQDAQLVAMGHCVDAVEAALIEHFAPCFNDVLNRTPTLLPMRYNPPTAKGRRPRSPSRMIHDAEQANRWAERLKYVENEG